MSLRGILFLIFVLWTPYLALSQDTLYLDDNGEEYYEDSSDDYYEDNDEEYTGRIFLIGADLNVMLPIGNFYKNTAERLKGGFNLSLLTQLHKEKGLMIGLDVAFNSMESSHGSYLDYDSEGYEWLLNYTTRTNYTMMLINTRYYFNVYWNKFSPYAEGLIGGKIMSTYSSYTDPTNEDFSDSEWHKFAFSTSFGLGLGMHYQVTNSIYIDARARFLQGAPITYYRLRDDRTEYDVGIDNFKKDNTKTDVAYYSLGLVFKF